MCLLPLGAAQCLLGSRRLMHISLFESWGNSYFHFLAWFEAVVLSLSLLLIPPHSRLPLSPCTEPLLPPKAKTLVCRGSQAASRLIIPLTLGKAMLVGRLVNWRGSQQQGEVDCEEGKWQNHSTCIPTSESSYQHLMG